MLFYLKPKRADVGLAILRHLSRLSNLVSYVVLVLIKNEWRNKTIKPSHWNIGLLILNLFVELGGGVGDVSSWCRDGTYMGFGFRWRWGLTDATVSLVVCSADSRLHSAFGSYSLFCCDNCFCVHHLAASRSVGFEWLQDRSENHYSDSIGDNYFMCG